MSQCSVERVIGRLVTDEAFRRRFAAHPKAAIDELVAGGLELNSCERHALASLDARRLEHLAQMIDPRIQKCDLHGGKPWH